MENSGNSTEYELHDIEQEMAKMTGHLFGVFFEKDKQLWVSYLY